MRHYCLLLLMSCVGLFGNSCGDRTSDNTANTSGQITQSTIEMPKPIMPTTAQETFASVCAVCHGVKGEGNLALRSPSIAGLPTWYVHMQLDKFVSHQRGTHPQDMQGQQMHAIAKALTPAMKNAAANSIEQLPHFPTTNTLGGNSVKGEDLFKNNCIDCHRYNASGEIAFRSAPLTGLQDWYMVAQLIKFRNGIRGKIAGDEDGAKMHLQTGSMTDEQFRDVVAYIADLAQRYRSEP